jgi:hypothetical protein
MTEDTQTKKVDLMMMAIVQAQDAQSAVAQRAYPSPDCQAWAGSSGNEMPRCSSAWLGKK